MSINCSIPIFIEGKKVKIGIRLLIVAIVFVSSTIFSLQTQSVDRSTDPSGDLSEKNKVIMTILADPLVQNKFFILAEAAKGVHLSQKNNQAYISPKDLKKLNILSHRLVSLIQNKYHIDPKLYKIHTYIGQDKFNSCYQYYNSFSKEAMNKTCQNYKTNFSTCRLCNEYLKALHLRGDNHIVTSSWWHNEEIIAFVDTFKLSNGDDAYVGLELSPPPLKKHIKP